MATKMVNGSAVEMTAQEEADFIASRTLSLADAKAAKVLQIEARQAIAERAGFQYSGFDVGSDPDQMRRYIVLSKRIETAVIDGMSVSWRNNSLSIYDSTMIGDIEKAAGDHYVLCMDNAMALKEAVYVCTTVAQVDAIDINVGWP